MGWGRPFEQQYLVNCLRFLSLSLPLLLTPVVRAASGRQESKLKDRSAPLTVVLTGVLFTSTCTMRKMETRLHVVQGLITPWQVESYGSWLDSR